MKSKLSSAIQFVKSNDVIVIYAAVFLLLIPAYFKATLLGNNILIMIITLLGVFFTVLFAVANREKKRQFSIRNYPALVCLALFLIIVVFNNNTELANGAGRLWIMQFGATAFAAFVIAFFPDKRWGMALLTIVSIAGLVYSLATIVLWFFPETYGPVYSYFRGLVSYEIEGKGYRAGLTTHYSTNGMYIATGLLTAVALAITQRKKRWVMLSAISFVALVLTTKRAHLAFSIISCLATYIVLNSNKIIQSIKHVVIVVVVALVGVGLFALLDDGILYVIKRFSLVFSDDSLGGRSGFYDLCISMWLSNPLFGCGWGSYTINFNQTPLGIRCIEKGLVGMDAHNVYLQVLAEEGLLGFCVITGAIISSLYQMTKRIITVNKGENGKELDRAYSSCMFAGSISIQLFFALYCLTGNPLYDCQMFVPWILSFGVGSIGMYLTSSKPNTN